MDVWSEVECLVLDNGANLLVLVDDPKHVWLAVLVKNEIDV